MSDHDRLERASRTMSHVNFAISPARNPALADSSTIIWFLTGCRVHSA
jgi:hypothetical protein